MATSNPQPSRELSAYLDQALTMSENDRSRWLAELAAEKPTLAARLRTLLLEHRALSDERFLEDVVSFPAQSTFAGQTIGAYTLVSPIGEGGMSTVWLAERSDGRFRRSAAIKFLSIALFGRYEDRFRREGSILGRLTHPHIAQLIDAGVSTSGRPYLVLEYVEGNHIDEYCDQRKLDVESRIRLFLDVLAAVAYAHANVIVHRDLKPSNVLVRTDGVVKLVDFGIAKILQDDERNPTATQLTREGGGALTPMYAAPEQLTSGAITTATDVYALGTLLYVLLSGEHPAGPGPHSYAEVVKAVVDNEPLCVSDAVVRTLADTDRADENAARRSTTPAKLRHALRGDLETIVMKALKKDPQDRYASVTAFAQDLHHYLQHEPISARPDTAAYRAAKFVRRNRVPVVLAGLALVAAATGVTGMMIEARSARAERDFAFKQLSRAEAINDLDHYVLSNAAPSGKPLTINNLLAGAERIVRRQETDLTTRVELLISIGSQYTVLDDYQKARQLLEEAHQLSLTISEPEIRARASCKLAQVLSRGTDPARAEALFQEGINELSRDSLYVDERITCLLRGSETSFNGGRAKEGLARAEAAQRLVEQSRIHSDPVELDALIVLAGAYNYAGRRTEAAATYEKAAARLKSLGRDDTQMASTLFNNWGTTLLRGGRPLAAEEALRRSIAIARDGSGEDSISATTLSNYAAVLYELNRLDEAADYAERGYAKAKEAGDEASIDQVLLHRARIYRAKGDLVRAGEMLLEVAPRLHRSLPPGHIAFGVLAMELALNAQAAGNSNKALELANQAVSILEASAKTNRESLEYHGKILAHRSELQLQLGHTDAALNDAERALSMLQEASVSGSFSADVGRAYLALGHALKVDRKLNEARAAFASAAENLQSALGPDHADSRIAAMNAH